MNHKAYMDVMEDIAKDVIENFDVKFSVSIEHKAWSDFVQSMTIKGIPNNVIDRKYDYWKTIHDALIVKLKNERSKND